MVIKIEVANVALNPEKGEKSTPHLIITTDNTKDGVLILDKQLFSCSFRYTDQEIIDNIKIEQNNNKTVTIFNNGILEIKAE